MAALTAKNPRSPTQPLVVSGADVHQWPNDRPLVRIHRAGGDHPSAWSGLREYGPVLGCRWEPHPLPRGLHPGVGVAYAAADLTTAIAEAYQQRRRVDRLTGEPHLVAWRPARPLQLLDISGDWPLRAGASASLAQGNKGTCRNWARAIAQQNPRLDGLYTLSTMTGDPMAVLWSPSIDTFPTYPDLSGSLRHPTVAAAVRLAAEEIGFALD